MKRTRCFSLLLVALASSCAFGESSLLEQRVVEHTLSNGIKLLILERHFSPTVSIRMMFRVGSVDETTGKTGLAHMFEHMMFKGTKTLGTHNYAAEAPLLAHMDRLQLAIAKEKQRNDQADQKRIGDLIDELRVVEEKSRAYIVDNELWNLYEREGASVLNASTSRDFTQYMVDLPSNKIELWAILDSDRLKNPVFRQFYQEREVVKEERRMRIDTDPEGKLFEVFTSVAYQSHPYRNPTIGWEGDLDHLYVSDLVDFYQKHYTPDQLTISIVGDVKAQDTLRLVEKYFGNWRVAGPPPSHIAPEPKQTGARQTSVTFEAQPQVVLGYHIPGYPHPDQVIAYAVSYLLGTGSTSRFYKALVEKKKVAAAVETAQDYPGERYASLFLISAQARHPHTNAQVTQAIEHELNRLKKDPVEPWELEKVRAAVEVGILETLQTNSGMASTLVYNQSIFGDWRYLLRFQQQIKELSAQDIQLFARKYFLKDNLTVGALEPVKKS